MCYVHQILLNLKTLEWKDNSVTMIDQTKLPGNLVFIKCNNYNEIAKAIKNLVVRGAPAICVAGVYGLSLAVLKSKANTRGKLIYDLEKAKKVLLSTRPTAVNLSWGLDKIMKTAKSCNDIDEIKDLVVKEANKIAQDDIKNNLSIGKNGYELFDSNDMIMTHCNAGSLATVSYGTALGVIRYAKEHGKKIKVIVTETRPMQQGSRLTAFELKYDKISVDLIPDTAAGYVMINKLINKVIVGADRILLTGHVFNKIGTYQLAIIAKYHRIPFYVAAPTSTFDLNNRVQDIVIEQRKPDEVTKIGNKKTAPDNIGVINPAFDITPPYLITGIITEKGIIRSPYKKSIKKLIRSSQ